MVNSNFFKINLFFSIIIFCILVDANAQQDIVGFWKGYLKVSERDSLPLVISIIQDGDSIIAEFDSPHQYSFGNKVDHFSLVGDTFNLKFTNITYQGVVDLENKRIEGLYSQGKFNAPLVLEYVEKRDRLIRPQTPNPPFDYQIDDSISIDDPVTQQTVINGTLTWPSTVPTKATIILISGSGWQDRDGTLFGHKPFWVIADDLTKRGYAVFRYDDLPRALFAKSTTYDFAKYLDMIVDFLKKDERCKEIPIGFLGHSEGSMVAFISASKNRDVDFVISMAGVAQPFKEISLFQLEKFVMNDQIDDVKKEKMLALFRPIYEIIEKSKDSQTAMKELNRYLDGLAKELTEEERVLFNLTPKDMLGIRGMPLSPWTYNLYRIDAKRIISKTRCPVYAINGEMDFQVYYQTNLPLFQKYLKPHPLNRFDSFPGLNHLLQHCETGMVDEYGKIEETISPEVLEKIGLWMEMFVNNYNR